MIESASSGSGSMDASIIAGISERIPPVDDDTTLLIPTLGRDLLFDSLRSVLKGSRWPGSIIVVDQGRREVIGTWLAQIESLGIQTTHLQCRERGRSRGLNRGLERIGSRFVLITDDDCLADESWIETMRANLLEYPGRIFTGRIEAGGSGPVKRMPAWQRGPAWFLIVSPAAISPSPWMCFAAPDCSTKIRLSHSARTGSGRTGR
jgi:hypothetical protein